jgi:MazG family protein
MPQSSLQSEIAKSFSDLLAVVAELRQQCPWDRDQTAPGMAKHLIEEAYETFDAISRGESWATIDELGDLLVQILFQGVIAEERRTFLLKDVIEQAREKLIRRHPHVYGGVTANSSEAVAANWEKIKAEERKADGATSALDGIANSMPALMLAEKLGVRARGAGMDWADINDVLRKAREELSEVEDALLQGDNDYAASEIGDLMLAIANAPRFVGHDAEGTLRAACGKFATRFKKVEVLARRRGRDLKSMRPDEVESIWREAKADKPPSDR